MQNFIGVTALATRLFVACLTEQHCGNELEHGSRLECFECALKCRRLCQVQKFTTVIALATKLETYSVRRLRHQDNTAQKVTMSDKPQAPYMAGCLEA